MFGTKLLDQFSGLGEANISDRANLLVGVGALRIFQAMAVADSLTSINNPGVAESVSSVLRFPGGHMRPP